MKSAFLMHPLDAGYVKRSRHKFANVWARVLPDSAVEALLKNIKPYVHSRFSIGANDSGNDEHPVKRHDSMIIILPLTSKQMKELPKEFVLKKMIEACDIAYKNGAEVISLGAYTAIASNQGLDLVGKTKIGLTTGRAYTVYVVMEQAKRYYKKGMKICVVGGDGAIGSAVVKLASEYDIISINRDNIDSVYQCDIVISATSDLNKVIDASRLKQNAVVIDAAKPSDISRKVREDVKVVDGGVVRVPTAESFSLDSKGAGGAIDFGIDFDLGKNQAYACMAEAFILGMNDMKGNYCLGKEMDLKKVEEIGRKGERMGFRVV